MKLMTLNTVTTTSTKKKVAPTKVGAVTKKSSPKKTPAKKATATAATALAAKVTKKAKTKAPVDDDVTPTADEKPEEKKLFTKQALKESRDKHDKLDPESLTKLLAETRENFIKSSGMTAEEADDYIKHYRLICGPTDGQTVTWLKSFLKDL